MRIQAISTTWDPGHTRASTEPGTGQFRAAGDGIQLLGPSTGLETSTLTNNTANRNGNLGIEAVPGVNDGGGNHAAGNGNPLDASTWSAISPAPPS